MTCFASFFGLLPMALATGIGADVTKPLAIVVVGGIGLVPIFILVIFPALIDRLGRPRDLSAAGVGAGRAARARGAAGMRHLIAGRDLCGRACAGAGPGALCARPHSAPRAGPSAARGWGRHAGAAATLARSVCSPSTRPRTG
jgi:hypothetical protein